MSYFQYQMREQRLEAQLTRFATKPNAWLKRKYIKGEITFTKMMQLAASSKYS